MSRPVFVGYDVYAASDAKHKFVRRVYHTGRSVLAKSRLTKAVEAAKKKGVGHIVGWKKVKDVTGTFKYIAKLQISIGSQMRCPLDYKCRASRAKVLAFYGYITTETDRWGTGTLGEEATLQEARPFNKFHIGTPYIKGKWVVPEHPFTKYNVECASGIHFFLTVEEALEW